LGLYYLFEERMTKKHFERLAACIKDIEDDYSREELCHEVGKVCADLNQRFDWDKWEEACGCKD